MPKYTVDGSFFVQQLSGIQRYAREILAAMDPMLEPGELEVAVPPDCIVPEYRNIKVVTLPQSSGILGWQRVYGRYLAQSGRCWLGMCNVIPMFHRGNEGIAVVHDVCYKARPDFYTDLRGRTSAVWHCMQYAAIAKKARKIVTVSEFSKSEIVKYYHVNPEKITVVYNAWQHMQRVRPDPMLFGEYSKWPQLKKGEYYFSMSNLLKNKNFPWVLRAAQSKPQVMFAIAGGGSLAKEAAALGLDHLNNVMYLGYVTDGEAKSLMERKNHDYGEAWRSMRISSLCDMVLQKILRVKQIEDNGGRTCVSEGVEANYYDMLNYSVFALIKLAENHAW